MNKSMLALIALTGAATAPVLAANFGAPSAATPSPGPVTVASIGTPVSPSVLSGPQISPSFRIVRPDGSTIIQQGSVGANVAVASTINVRDSDAFVSSNGRCAFNIKYDELSGIAAKGTINRLYSNDRLIAQNSMIDLAPGVLRTIWTQPYLTAGMNYVRLVVNADGATPSTGWIRVNVAGSCGGPVATAPATTPPPVVAPPPAPVVSYAPGSSQWNAFNTAWGYTNYGVTQLKGKSYSRYDELVKLNAALTAAVNAKTVTQADYNALMGSWNSFVSDAGFKAALTAAAVGPLAQK